MISDQHLNALKKNVDLLFFTCENINHALYCTLNLIINNFVFIIMYSKLLSVIHEYIMHNVGHESVIKYLFYCRYQERQLSQLTILFSEPVNNACPVIAKRIGRVISIDKNIFRKREVMNVNIELQIF